MNGIRVNEQRNPSAECHANRSPTKDNSPILSARRANMHVYATASFPRFLPHAFGAAAASLHEKENGLLSEGNIKACTQSFGAMDRF